MNKKILAIFILLIPLFFLLVSNSLAQTTQLGPSSQVVDFDTGFNLTLNVDSVSDLFSVSFDLNFDPSLVSYVSVEKEDFLSSGCPVTLLADEVSPGKLVVGLTRLGSSCGGVSGSGALMTFHFQSLSQEGISNFTFSNNSLCILENSSCNFIKGDWLSAEVMVGRGEQESDSLVLEPLGNYQYRLKANIGSYSNIDINDAYIIGWQGDWQNLIPMDKGAELGWAEVVLSAEKEGLQKFCITNSSKTEWFWVNIVDHQLIIPSLWTDKGAGQEDKVFAFWADGPSSFSYINGSLIDETLSLEPLGNYQYRLKANIGSYSNIDINDAYIIGWQGDWQNLIPMDKGAELGWAEVVLSAEKEGLQKFCITNSSKTEWFWVNIVDHQLIIPSLWTDKGAGQEDLLMAFIVDSADAFKYINGSLVD